jgi:hypothetical protein
MQPAFRALLLCLSCSTVLAFGQDEPSLGDAARQARQQKQQKNIQAKDVQSKDGLSKDGQTKDAQPARTPRVITNEEIPEHSPIVASTSGPQPGGTSSPSSGAAKMSPEQWKSQIFAQKNVIVSTQSEIDKLNDSIHFAPANCVANCVQWNQRQHEKQQEVERLQAQLEDQKKRLEDMQESARRQGYGSSVYDP